MGRKIKTMCNRGPSRLFVGCRGVVLGLLLVWPAFSVAEPFGDITQRIEPIPPIEPPPPPEDIDEKPVPPPRKPIPQRIHMLDEKSFMILPEDTPLPHGTISNKTLDGEEEGLSPVLEPVPLPRQPTLKAKIFEAVDGKKYLRLAGLSYGRQLSLEHIASLPAVAATEEKQQEKPVSQEVAQEAIQEEEPEQSAVPAPAPTPPPVASYQAAFRYLVDDITPEKAEQELTKLVKKMEGKKLRRVYIMAQASRVPLVAPTQLPSERWAHLRQQLTAAGLDLSGVPISHIYLAAPAGAQALALELITQE